VTGIGNGTVSTLLVKVAKSAELTKAQRGYALPAVATISADGVF